MLRLQGVSSPDSASRKSTMSIYSLLDPCPRASVPTTARATSPRMSSSNVICSPWPSTTHCLRPNKASPPPSSQALNPRRTRPIATQQPPSPVRCSAHSARISLARYPSATRLDLTLCAPLRHLCRPRLRHHL
jgi:hypothetical protein